MIAAITGLIQSGKSTLFSSISGQEPAAPGHTGKVGAIITVPEGRFKWLTKYYKPRKVTYANIDCYDIPGLDFSDEKGRSMARKIFTRVRLADIVVMVVGAFDSGEDVDVETKVRNDLNTLQTEFLLADLEMVHGRVERLEKDVLKPTSFQDQKKEELQVWLKLMETLEAEKPVSGIELSPAEIDIIKPLGLLTMKPMVVVINTDEGDPAREIGLAGIIDESVPVISVCSKLEQELSLLDEMSRVEFMKELGIIESAASKFVGSVYDAMGLISFLTVGEDEVRAWPISRGTIARDAAGKVHSDIKRGFIRAETMAYDELREFGSEKALRAAGRIRLEGRKYVVQDGDIMSYRFSV